MPPSDDDIKELWCTVDEMRTILAKNGMALSRIETLLSERCATRGRTLDEVIKSQEKHEDRLKRLEERFWWMGGASAAVGALFGWFLKTFGGGGHG